LSRRFVARHEASFALESCWDPIRFDRTKKAYFYGVVVKNTFQSGAVCAFIWVVAGWADAAECVIAEESKKLDPVEVGFCKSDAVFVGKVEGRMETIRAYRDEGSEQTKHFRTELSTVAVVKSFKGELTDKVTMTSELYDKKGAFSFQRENEYLVFAKKVPNGNEYAGASAACSVQPTVLVAAAEAALKQLEDHKSGRKKIDCKNIRPKG
jgi:hypothetical protein